LAEADLLLASLGLVDAELPVLVDGDRTFTATTVEIDAVLRSRPRHAETLGAIS
jgi:hypothetical protein